MLGANKSVEVGVGSVVIGNVSGSVGDRSLVIAATDQRVNVILDRPMAVGYNAHAGPGSIAIGANASAGSELTLVLGELRRIIEAGNDRTLKVSFERLCVELGRVKKNRTRIRQLWETVKASATMHDAIGLVLRATELIRSIGG